MEQRNDYIGKTINIVKDMVNDIAQEFIVNDLFDYRYESTYILYKILTNTGYDVGALGTYLFVIHNQEIAFPHCTANLEFPILNDIVVPDQKQFDPVKKIVRNYYKNIELYWDDSFDDSFNDDSEISEYCNEILEYEYDSDYYDKLSKITDGSQFNKHYELSEKSKEIYKKIRNRYQDALEDLNKLKAYDSI
jgi:hypothetical protein